MRKPPNDEHYYEAVRAGVRDAFWQALTNASDAPCEDTYQSIRDGVKDAFHQAALLCEAKHELEIEKAHEGSVELGTKIIDSLREILGELRAQCLKSSKSYAVGTSQEEKQSTQSRHPLELFYGIPGAGAETEPKTDPQEMALRMHKMRQALGFYADPKNYTDSGRVMSKTHSSVVKQDDGEIAREALGTK